MSYVKAENNIEANINLKHVATTAVAETTPQARKEARTALGLIMQQDIRVVPEGERLAWLQHGQLAYIYSAYQETGEDFSVAKQELFNLTGNMDIISALSDDGEILAYAQPVRDRFLNQANEFAERQIPLSSAMALAWELTTDPNILFNIPMDQRAAYIEPMLTVYTDRVAAYHEADQQGHFLAHSHIINMIKEPNFRNGQSDKGYEAYVSNGISRLVDIRERFAAQESPYEQDWKDLIRKLADDHMVAPHISEEVMKKAGFLTVDVENVAEMHVQLGIILDFLGNKPQEKRDEYARLVTDKAAAIKADFAAGKIGVTDIEDPNVVEKTAARVKDMKSQYWLLRNTAQNSRLSGLEVV